MSSQAEIIRSYLVELGFEIDNAALTKFKSAIDALSQLVQDKTMGMAKAYVSAAAEIVTALATVGVATASLFDKIAQADLGYQKYALHMYMAGDAAKQLKIVTDAMGESLEDIRWMPQLHEMFGRNMADAARMEPPKDAKGQLEYIRDIRNEFTRLKIESTYGLQQVGYYLFKYLEQPIAGIKWGFKDFNEYIIANMPIWSERIAYFFAETVELVRTALRLFGELKDIIVKVWDAMADEEKATAAVAVLGLLFFVGGPITKGIMLLGFLLIAAQDFYNYMDGRDSVTGRIVNYFKEMTAGLEDFKLVLDPIVATLKMLGTLLATVLRLPLLLIHGLLLGIKGILFGLNVVKTISMGGSAADVEKISDKFLDNITPHIEGVDKIFGRIADSVSGSEEDGGLGTGIGIDGGVRGGLPVSAGGRAGVSLSKTGYGVPDENKYDALILDAAKRHKVDPALIKAIMYAESTFKWDAKSKRTKMGVAKGLMQLTDAKRSEKTPFLPHGVVNPFDPFESIEGGTSYIANLMKMYPNDPEKVYAAYNAGEGAVDKYHGVPPYDETRGFVAKVGRARKLYSGQHFGEGAGVSIGTVTNHNAGNTYNIYVPPGMSVAQVNQLIAQHERSSLSKKKVPGTVQ